MAASAIQMVSKAAGFTWSGFTAKIMDVTGPKFIREFLDITNQATTLFMENTPAVFVDAEDITFTFQSNDTDNFRTLIVGAQATLVVTRPVAIGRATASSWSVTAGVKAIGDSQTLGQVVKGEITFKSTGDWTFTAGS